MSDTQIDRIFFWRFRLSIADQGNQWLLYGHAEQVCDRRQAQQHGILYLNKTNPATDPEVPHNSRLWEISQFEVDSQFLDCLENLRDL